MPAIDHLPPSHESEPENGLLTDKDRSRAREHLELDGVFWLETAGAQLERWFGRAPRSHASTEAGGWIALSGEPWVGFNVACVLDSPRSDALFMRYAERLRDLPGVVIAERVTHEILEIAERLRARDVGEIPFMVFDKETPPTSPRAVEVSRVTALADLTPTVVLIADAFSMNVQACLDVFEPTLGDPNAAIWTATKDGRLVSAMMTLRVGNIVGLHCLATSDEIRGRGIAHSLVCQVMERHMSSGTRRFFLHTTDQGRRFAEAVGYRAVVLPHTFVINEDANTSAISVE